MEPAHASGIPPSARQGHTAIYDPGRNRMVVFGGSDGGSSVWALSLSGSPAWSSSSPLGRCRQTCESRTQRYTTRCATAWWYSGGGGGAINNESWALVWGQPAVGVDHRESPDRLALAPPRPNPFRGRVTFDFEVPRAAHVRLEVYDLRGRRVKTVEDARLDPGRYSRIWDGSDGAGAPPPEGVYFVRLWSPGVTLRQKVVLIR